MATEMHNLACNVIMELSVREANLIKRFCLLAFGKVIVYQGYNQPVRIEEIRSVKLQERR